MNRLIPAALFFFAIPAGVAVANEGREAIEEIVAPCRNSIEIALAEGKNDAVDSYIGTLLSDREDRQIEIVACAAYMLGAADMAEGRIKPIEVPVE